MIIIKVVFDGTCYQSSFQTTVASLEEEYKKAKKEVEEVHEERVLAGMNEKKRQVTDFSTHHQVFNEKKSISALLNSTNFIIALTLSNLNPYYKKKSQKLFSIVFPVQFDSS